MSDVEVDQRVEGEGDFKTLIASMWLNRGDGDEVCWKEGRTGEGGLVITLDNGLAAISIGWGRGKPRERERKRKGTEGKEGKGRGRKEFVEATIWFQSQPGLSVTTHTQEEELRRHFAPTPISTPLLASPLLSSPLLSSLLARLSSFRACGRGSTWLALVAVSCTCRRLLLLLFLLDMVLSVLRVSS